MRKWLIVAAAAFQVLVLASMAIEREWVVARGTMIRLRTAPIDPRDPFRGDYVRLRYEISTIPQALLRDGLAAKAVARDSRVFAVLEVDDGGLARLKYATDRRPGHALFIRGRASRGLDWGPVEGTNVWRQPLEVRYGLEAYFVEQGAGLELERQRQQSGIQIPLAMEVAVGGSGLAVLTGHQWSKLGIGLGLGLGARRGRPEPGMPPSRPDTLATLRLLNASDEPLAIVDLPGGRSFALETALNSQRPWTWVGADQPPPKVEGAHVRVLEPGQVHTTRIDLGDPMWQVVGEDGKRAFLRDLEWSDWFRLVYAPPSEADCGGLRDADRIWHGRLPSRAFNARRSVD